MRASFCWNCQILVRVSTLNPTIVSMRQLLIVLLLVVAGCAAGGRIQYESPREAFENGELYFAGQKYDRAIQYYRGVFDFGRTHEWASDAQLKLARAYRLNREFILAADEYANFVRLYRADPRVADAEFERAMTFYERSPSFELDQSETERGIEVFNVFLQRFPDHDSVAVATQRVRQLRDKLATKAFHGGGLYERRQLFEAAALSYEVVFEKYPDTPMADDALLGAIRCYIEFSNQSVAQRQPERLQKALDHYQRLLQLFPDSPLLKDAEVLYSRAAALMDEVTAS